MPGPKYDKAFRSYLADIGAKIRSLRDDLGLSTEQAAEKAGISPGYWGLVERASKQPSLQSLFKFAHALSVDVADLVTVGIARHEVLAKSRHRKVDQILDQATPAQAKAMLMCCRAIVALGEAADRASTGTKARR